MTTLKYILIALTITSMAALISCGGDDNPTPVADPTQEVIDGLAKSWTTSSVTLDNSDVTGDWSGFTLTFDPSKGYTATNLSVESILVWPVSGSYSFTNANNAKQVTRNDGVQITITSITETTATLTFRITGRNGRTDGLIGEWVFNMGS